MDMGDLEVYKERRGNMYLMDMNKPEGEPHKFSISGDIDLEMFNPLGTTVWQTKGYNK